MTTSWFVGDWRFVSAATDILQGQDFDITFAAFDILMDDMTEAVVTRQEPKKMRDGKQRMKNGQASNVKNKNAFIMHSKEELQPYRRFPKIYEEMKFAKEFVSLFESSITTLIVTQTNPILRDSSPSHSSTCRRSFESRSIATPSSSPNPSISGPRRILQTTTTGRANRSANVSPYSSTAVS